MLRSFEIPADDAQQRADRYIRKCLPNITLSRLHSLFRKKEIKVGKKPILKNYFLQEGEILNIYGLQAEEMETVFRLGAAKNTGWESGDFDGDNDIASETDRKCEVNEKNSKDSSVLYSKHNTEKWSNSINTDDGNANSSENSTEFSSDAVLYKGYKTAKLEFYNSISKANSALKNSNKKSPFPLLYDDNDLCVIDKPAGWAVHPGSDVPLGKTIVEVMQAYLPLGDGLFKPSLIHRLDRDTSGVLLMAKSGTGLREWTRIMREETIEKCYYALVSGIPSSKAGLLEDKLQKAYQAGSGEKMRVGTGAGKIARTHYKVVGESKAGPLPAALLELKIETGRTHQIRTQLAHFGHPVLGDRKYGNFEHNAQFAKAVLLRRLFLHAHSLRAQWNEKKFYIASALPNELVEVLNSLHIQSPCPQHSKTSSKS